MSYSQREVERTRRPVRLTRSAGPQEKTPSQRTSKHLLLKEKNGRRGTNLQQEEGAGGLMFAVMFLSRHSRKQKRKHSAIDSLVSFLTDIRRGLGMWNGFV